MKIVYDHQIFAMQEYGGVSRYFVELTRQLSKQADLQVNLQAPLHFNRYLSGLDAGVVRGLRIPRLPLSGHPVRLINNFISQLGVQSRATARSADIIHTTYYFPYRKPPGSKAKVVVTVHDMVYELYPQNFPASDRTAELKHAAVMQADHVICVSANTLDDLVRITGIQRDKVSVVHHGVNEIGNQEVVDPGFKEFSYLLYVGERQGYKNFSALLHAYAGCDKLHGKLKLVCFGGGRFSAGERALQLQLGLNKGQVHWLTGGDPLLASLYRHAAAFVYPSLYEGFGMPPLEAMSCGCPVVCSNVGSIPEVVGNAGEFFDSRDTDALIASLCRVTGDAVFAAQLRDKGTLRLKNFSWQKCAAETLNIYRTLLQSNSQ